jgi:hypothetical protein
MLAHSLHCERPKNRGRESFIAAWNSIDVEKVIPVFTLFRDNSNGEVAASAANNSLQVMMAASAYGLHLSRSFVKNRALTIIPI